MKKRMPESDWERMEIDEIKEKPNQKFRKPEKGKVSKLKQERNKNDHNRTETITGG